MQDARSGSKALLVVDMQVGCLAGRPPRYQERETITRINALARGMRPLGPIIFIQHTDADAGFARGSADWQLSPSLDRGQQDQIIEKTACDSFLETSLAAILKAQGVTELVIVGCATDFCVDTTVRAAASQGFQVTVPSDGHTTRDRPHLSAEQIIAHHNYMWAELLLPRQQKVRVLTTAALLSEP